MGFAAPVTANPIAVTGNFNINGLDSAVPCCRCANSIRKPRLAPLTLNRKLTRLRVPRRRTRAHPTVLRSTEGYALSRANESTDDVVGGGQFGPPQANICNHPGHVILAPASDAATFEISPRGNCRRTPQFVAHHGSRLIMALGQPPRIPPLSPWHGTLCRNRISCKQWAYVDSAPDIHRSTFVDMQAERDYYARACFPNWKNGCARAAVILNGSICAFGVATASQRDERTRELHVLKVCLAEVARCRPFVLASLETATAGYPRRSVSRRQQPKLDSLPTLRGAASRISKSNSACWPIPSSRRAASFISENRSPIARCRRRSRRLFRCARYWQRGCRSDEAIGAAQRRIEMLLPDRVRRYAATWDTEHHRSPA